MKLEVMLWKELHCILEICELLGEQIFNVSREDDAHVCNIFITVCPWRFA